jgi:hypothetical protein
LSEQKINKRLKNIINNLSSKDKKKIFSALKQLRTHGNKEAIIPLIETLIRTNDNEIKREIINLFYDLRDQAVVETLISAIQNDKYFNIKATLISIFWESTLDGSQYISTFVKEALKGDYLIGIEVLTVIENFDCTFSEDEINDLKFDIDEAIEIEKTEKVNLLISMKNVLDLLIVEY